MALTFKNQGSQSLGDTTINFVYLDGVKIGRVDKKERWTVRGTRIEWMARTRTGSYLAGPCETRRAAGEAVLEAHNLRTKQDA